MPLIEKESIQAIVRVHMLELLAKLENLYENDPHFISVAIQPNSEVIVYRKGGAGDIVYSLCEEVI